MKLWLKRFLEDKCGAAALEYAFIGLFITVVIGASIAQIGTKLSPVFASVATTLNP